MDMHKKIVAFAMSLDMKESKDNRLLLLTNQGLLSALPVFSFAPQCSQKFPSRTSTLHLGHFTFFLSFDFTSFFMSHLQ